MTGINLANLPLLEGSQNFRAVKPYPAAGGRHLRTNILYRSGELSRLTQADRQAVAALNIQLVCDLRSPAEQTEFPTAWPVGPAPHWLELPDRDDSPAGPANVFDLILSHPGDAGARQAMALLYHRKPRVFAASLLLMFETLLRGDALPVLIHCHAGKDRTGFVTAIILAAIGVSQADIIDDYVTTAIFFPVEAESIAIAEWARRAFNRQINPDQAVPLVEARPEYIGAAFEAIAAEWGTVENYLTKAVGLTEAMRQQLQTLLLA